MKLPTCCLSCLVVAFATSYSTVAKADHDHKSCACAAAEEGFEIDCGNQDAMTAALSVLSTNGCGTDCTSQVCHRNYLIIQSHHDYCLEDELPPTLEDGIHFYEGSCNDCKIVRKFDPSLPMCPQASCGDTTGDDAWNQLVSLSCDADCTKSDCEDHFRTLKVVHDTCPEDTLSTAAEINYHDFEASCHGLYGCNPPRAAGASALVCEEEGTSAATTSTNSIVFTAGALAVTVAWVTMI